MSITSKSVHLAKNDDDLRGRFVAAAAIEGVPDPEWWVDRNLYALVVQNVGTGGNDTVASVYQYAVDTYNPTPRPGANMAAVNDSMLAQAVNAVYVEPVTP